MRLMLLILAILTVPVAMSAAVLALALRHRGALAWSFVLAAGSALVAWGIRDFKAAKWKSEQSLHIRSNVMEFRDLYNRVERLGDADLRRDFVTNFCDNAGTLLNLDCKNASNTSNLVENFYLDWDKRIGPRESGKEKY